MSRHIETGVTGGSGGRTSCWILGLIVDRSRARSSGDRACSRGTAIHYDLMFRVAYRAG